MVHFRKDFCYNKNSDKPCGKSVQKEEHTGFVPARAGLCSIYEKAK